jgi:hypothetical protein
MIVGYIDKSGRVEEATRANEKSKPGTRDLFANRYMGLGMHGLRGE